ncbi:MAG: DUF1015 family protein [Lachnospiraceae bacterium]|nr:DUF1015 family protein [Lachnospiraceae bacterium]
MADIKPFQCIHPAEGYAARVAALPYDVYNRREAYEEAAKDRLSFLNIDRPETQFEENADMYAPEVYQKARELLQERIRDGVFVQDEQRTYYLYELTMDGRSQTGLVACASIDDYVNNIIKKHENTRAEKEADRIRHVDVCSAQTGPIFLAYRRDEQIQAVTARIKQERPVFAFTSKDGITHRGWCISDAADIDAIQQAFDGISRIYIADGHHRAASAVRVGLKRREQHPDYNGNEEFNYFLSILFPDDELMIMDYNRVVKDLNGLTKEEFLAKAEERFSIDKCGDARKPEKKGCMTMYLGDEWYHLTVREEYRSADPVEGLDVSILQKELLGPVLGISDPKKDARIDFIGGIRGLSELERRVHTDCAVAFAMYPTSIAELFAVADAGRLMPPKSTWFEPKLRSGLFIHGIEE